MINPMTYEQYIAVNKAYDDLINCFLSAGNMKAVETVQIHKLFAEVEWGKQSEKEEAYYMAEKPLEVI
jgi:hypothetical protein